MQSKLALQNEGRGKAIRELRVAANLSSGDFIVDTKQLCE